MAAVNGVNPSSRPPSGRSQYQIPVNALAIYPAILLLGSLYSILSPTAYPPSNSVLTNKGTRPPAANYFARKDNVVNLYFVKIGWAWTTAAFLSLLWAHPVFNSKRVDLDCRLRRIWQAVLRYTLVTVGWILTTQWCFGPAIIDRSFTATGGSCHAAYAPGHPAHAPDSGAPFPAMEAAFTAAACKSTGGAWTGGHDVSGHVLMLVLASAFLSFELAGAFLSSHQNLEVKDKARPSQEPDGILEETQPDTALWSRNFVLGVIGLSLWMLLMTGIWFHTWLEKLSGLVIALGLVYGVYILPRTVEPVRTIIGIPGI